jgi:hypothetical protein
MRSCEVAVKLCGSGDTATVTLLGPVAEHLGPSLLGLVAVLPKWMHRTAVKGLPDELTDAVLYVSAVQLSY